MTSQIFANIYLNEFDQFVRHKLKPLVYVRYGDDFVLFFSSENEAKRIQGIASKRLHESLHLTVHKTNNLILPANAGLHFLGHQIYSQSQLAVDKAMSRKVRAVISPVNAATYRAMHISKKRDKELSWKLLGV